MPLFAAIGVAEARARGGSDIPGAAGGEGSGRISGWIAGRAAQGAECNVRLVPRVPSAGWPVSQLHDSVSTRDGRPILV